MTPLRDSYTNHQYSEIKSVETNVVQKKKICRVIMIHSPTQMWPMPSE